MYTVIFAVTLLSFGTNAMSTGDWTKAVSGFYETFTEYYDQKDLSAIVGLHSDDVHMLPPGRPTLGLSELISLVWGTMFTVSHRSRIRATSLMWVCGDTAVTEFITSKVYEDGRTRDDKGVMLLRMENGTLEMVSCAWNKDY